MPVTIRTKIILGFAASLIFVSILSMAFGLNIMTLKNKIVVLDEFHGLLARMATLKYPTRGRVKIPRRQNVKI